MRRVHALQRSLVILSAMLAFSDALASAQTVTTVVRSAALPVSAPTTAAASGTGVILGQVVDADTGRPIPGAVVTLGGGPANAALMASGPGTPGGAPTVLANAQGQFIFRDLVASAFTLSVQAPGYLPSAYGQRRPDGGPARSIELADGQRVLDATIRAWKVGVITGRVVDEVGDPVVGVQVRSLRRDSSGRLNTGTTQNTDDRGVYRFGGLVPGDYLVVVTNTFPAVPSALVDSLTGPNASFNLPLSRDGVASLTIGLSGMSPNMRFGDMQIPTNAIGSSSGLAPNLSSARIRAYPTTFHPSSASPQDAAVVRLTSGQERDDVDIAMRLMPMFSVSGLVSGPTGPMPSMGLRLMPAFGASLSFENGFEAAVTTTGPDGRFTFLGVPPGQFEIRAMRMPQTISAPSTMTMINTGTGSMGIGMAGALPRLTDDPTLWATTPVSVSATDVTGLTLTLQNGARLRGHVEFLGAAPPPPADRPRLAINLLVAGDRQGQTPQPGLVEEDLSFKTAEYPPGRYFVNVTGAPPGWSAVDARLGGANAITDAFTIDGSAIDDVVVTLTNRQTKLSGTVRGAGAGDPNAVVVLFPFDHQAWIESGMTARLARTVDVRPNGTFDISNLLPGTYAIAAVPANVGIDLRNARQIESIAQGAMRLVIGVGEQKVQALSVTPVR